MLVGTIMREVLEGRAEGGGRRECGSARRQRQWRECSDAMHSFMWAAAAAALLALAAARTDQDFEFDDEAVSITKSPIIVRITTHDLEKTISSPLDVINL